MTGRSHVLIGIASVVAACAEGWLAVSPFVLIGGVFGSLLPDIDTERSTLGHRCKWVARPIGRMFGHRGATHSGLLLGLAVVCLVYFGGAARLHGGWGALCLGYASHIVADMPTGGVPLLYPVSKSRISLWPYARTGGIGEFLLLLCTLTGLFGLAWWSGHNVPIRQGSGIHIQCGLSF
ncbi:hypothetical protein AA101099_2352 [Neoasaia chiangmaiensis NBRC 101099]|uniref:Uncharacterized protein n=1 Tax=Neoasaia chiangmaiensis TaxID=320497 RepID=A0A1U9KS98_9PROT|nr:metal-dependent hydrolase [Neoasaia chiangmaiensis]AQS88703.1 hypothetical protein A0U93_13135 [Neoasaia chiangmaiensis]GBR40986.1 hypothetical protein AA101099_2352 [Neoasaia chiangmaiensis NBRC 101099]GEN13659.1 membrane protein [Neoasaia chiangmaiensis]